MKKNEKIMIAVLVGITILVAIIFIVGKTNKEKDINENTVPIIEKEEFVDKLEDGTRLNNSSKLKETKKIDGIEISDFQLTEKDNVTLLLGTAKNTSGITRGGYPVDVKVLDKYGNEIVTISAFLGKLEPGESTQFSTSATFDCVNAYDFSITKK